VLQGSATAGDPDSALLPAPDKMRKEGEGCRADTDTEADTMAATAYTIGLEPLETVAELSRARVGQIVREMEEIERIARATGSSAKLLQRTVITSAVVSTWPIFATSAYATVALAAKTRGKRTLRGNLKKEK
jgi:hypothetical protein